MRLLHRGAATALVTMAVPSLFVGLAVARSNRIRSRRFLLVAVVIAIAVTPVLGVFTGRLLPWDQLALWARHRGDLNSGFLPFIASSGDIQFVVVGGVEVAVEWVRQWLLAHLTVGAATVVALVGGWMMRRQRPGEP
jgi:quinol-cytochrome oxidoreductase complex cytochrome b subunit